LKYFVLQEPLAPIPPVLFRSAVRG